MEIKHHIGFRVSNAPDLILYLNENEIPYHKALPISTLVIYESNPHWQTVLQYIHKYNLTPITETEYTQEELTNATWLRIRSRWQNGYPQPEGHFEYEHITYSNKSLCCECGCGLVQVNPFRLRKQPNWGQRNFFQLNWIGDELFISNNARTVFENHNFSGMAFNTVMNKSGDVIFPNVCQLVIPFILEKGLVVEGTDFKKQTICSRCGEAKYVLSGRGSIMFKKEALAGAPDVVKTFEQFGGGHYATRLILIRQKVYQAIMTNHLDKGLVFEPIGLT